METTDSEKQHPTGGLPALVGSLTVSQFCSAHGISRGTLYGLWREGRGPRFILLGAIRRIPHDAALAWQQHELTNSAAPDVAAAVERASRAGKASAAAYAARRNRKNHARA
jgi:hypothetical protein